MDELEDIYSKLSVDLYHSMKVAMESNFVKVKEYEIPEDWLCKRYPFLFDSPLAII